MSNGFMLYRCDFEKQNPIQNQHWFYHSFENAMEKFRTLLQNDILQNYNNSTQYDIYTCKKEQMIDGCCRLLFQSDDEMIWLEAIVFSDK